MHQHLGGFFMKPANRLSSTASLLALISLGALAGCNLHPDDNGKTVRLIKAPKAISRLDCPDQQGALKRQSTALDGRSCAYGDGKGQDVVLRLVSIGEKSPETVISAIEAELAPDMPEGRIPARPQPPMPPEPPSPGEPVSDIPAAEDNVDIDLPGMKIHAGNDGAQVHIGPMTIDARDEGDSASITAQDPSSDTGKHVEIKATGSSATLRVDSAADKDTVRRALLVTTDKPGKSGYRLIAYEINGPSSGPLVVGIVKGRSRYERSIVGDLKRLVRRNASD
jgi:hypothetical protein